MVTTNEQALMREFGWEIAHDFESYQFVGVNQITGESTPKFPSPVEVFDWIKHNANGKDRL